MSIATATERRAALGISVNADDAELQLDVEVDHYWIPGAAMDGKLLLYGDQSMAVVVRDKYIALRRKTERSYARDAIAQARHKTSAPLVAAIEVLNGKRSKSARMADLERAHPDGYINVTPRITLESKPKM